MDIEHYARSLFTDELLAKLADRSLTADERARAAVALAGIGEDPNTLYRRQQMALCKDEAVFTAAEAYLSDEKPKIRRWALQALLWLPAYHPDPTALPVLRSLLYDDRREVQFEVVELVGRCEHVDAVHMLEPLLKRYKKQKAVTNRVLLALGNTGQDAAVDILLRHRAERAAVRAMARMPNERAVRAVLEIALAAPHNDLWGPLIHSARQLGMQDVVDICKHNIDEINSHYPPR